MGVVARVCRQCTEAMGRMQTAARHRSGFGDEARPMTTSMGERHASLLTLPQLMTGGEGRSEFRLTECGEDNGENEHVRQDFFYEQASFFVVFSDG